MSIIGSIVASPTVALTEVLTFFRGGAVAVASVPFRIGARVGNGLLAPSAAEASFVGGRRQPTLPVRWMMDVAAVVGAEVATAAGDRGYAAAHKSQRENTSWREDVVDCAVVGFIGVWNDWRIDWAALVAAAHDPACWIERCRLAVTG